MRPTLRLAQRTLRALRPAAVDPDDAWARRRLSTPEYAAYARMDARDRDHVCRVAKRLAARADTPERLVRAALLHDVGKAVRPYRLVERILVHALPIPPAAFGRWREPWLVHRDHPHLGAAALRALGSDPQVIEWVERHHERPAPNEALAALAAADEAA